jgi:hypothetical protein
VWLKQLPGVKKKVREGDPTLSGSASRVASLELDSAVPWPELDSAAVSVVPHLSIAALAGQDSAGNVGRV